MRGEGEGDIEAQRDDEDPRLHRVSRAYEVLAAEIAPGNAAAPVPRFDGRVDPRAELAAMRAQIASLHDALLESRRLQAAIELRAADREDLARWSAERERVEHDQLLALVALQEAVEHVETTQADHAEELAALHERVQQVATYAEALAVTVKRQTGALTRLRAATNVTKPPTKPAATGTKPPAKRATKAKPAAG